MPHKPKENAEEMDGRAKPPEFHLPGERGEHEWRPSDAVKLPPLGSISIGEVLDEADDEWRPSDSAEE